MKSTRPFSSGQPPKMSRNKTSPARELGGPAKPGPALGRPGQALEAGAPVDAPYDIGGASPLIELADDQSDLGPLRPSGQRANLRELSFGQMAKLVADLGEEEFRASQLMSWIYRKGAVRFDDMTDIKLATRARLARAASVDPGIRLLERHQDPDGTLRLLWGLADRLTMESVLINERDHLTLCVSTQVGCRMGCRFCRTATLGFKRDLTQGEIASQITEAKRLIKDGRLVTNVVLMGMGEPLDNLREVLGALNLMTSTKALSISGKRISVSTVGVVPSILRIADEWPGFPCGLTISLGAPVDELRSSLMPVNRRWPLSALKNALARFPLRHGRRLTIAYALLAGVNDSPDHAVELSRFLAGLKTKINLIPFNSWPGAPFTRSADSVAEEFKNVLVEKHHTVIVRRSNGESVNAACGQLVGRGLQG